MSIKQRVIQFIVLCSENWSFRSFQWTAAERSANFLLQLLPFYWLQRPASEVLCKNTLIERNVFTLLSRIVGVQFRRRDFWHTAASYSVYKFKFVWRNKLTNYFETRFLGSGAVNTVIVHRSSTIWWQLVGYFTIWLSSVQTIYGNISQYRTLTVSHNISQYLAASISQYFRASHSISQYLTMTHSISRHSISRYLTVSHGISRYLTVSHSPYRHLRVSHSPYRYLMVSQSIAQSRDESCDVFPSSTSPSISFPPGGAVGGGRGAAPLGAAIASCLLCPPGGSTAAALSASMLLRSTLSCRPVAPPGGDASQR